MLKAALSNSRRLRYFLIRFYAGVVIVCVMFIALSAILGSFRDAIATTGISIVVAACIYGIIHVLAAKWGTSATNFRSPAEVQSMLVSFIDGTATAYAPADFIETPIDPAELEEIRLACARILKDHPADAAGKVVNAEGERRLQEIVRELNEWEHKKQ